MWYNTLVKCDIW